MPADPPGGRKAMAVWGIGVAVYFVAITYRTSLGVAGLDAAERFHINASALSTFSILQLLVYAGMQIPVGLLVDRLGPKKVLTIGVVLYTVGQFGFALSSSYAMALGSRALLGCGDAMTFISVLRLGSRWFPARRGPMIAQIAALVGMAGNLISTLVLARFLHSFGWTPTFAASAAGGIVVLIVLLLFLKDHPEGFEPPPASAGHAGAGFVRRQIADAWREPGTRLGMWVHFTTQFPAMVFLLLWGLPFLVEAQGLSRGTAGELLTLVVLSNMAVGLVFGQIIARHHAARTPLALGTVGATGLMWAIVLAWPADHAPMGLLIVLCTVLGACGPASMIGFDFARPANPPERQGTASGIVNMGGFTASMTTLLAVGVLLDATGDNYRIAFASIFVLEALGVSQILRLRRRAARRERERLVVSRVEAVHVPA
ncbi:MFS transporter [Streptomyces sp. Je 1-4]|uniref:MFS transporter n=2 Tax=Streptomyces TaxID=1883 RepID=UPI0021D8B443|nr:MULTISPECIES: MFS transporter [unclassified Streptomyces]UYB44869.1 MFS transporter [Streptomyces sp. Je 1-4]UZQ37565.1 MFS transporter [Streptomyces sp. Je 1-4] [Streptomyces sp. Je 1-4 4N24]UZQ44982.1 MFS transporter [Streptomyces sp. Je 1-4] [Streptomyces sp. Je 1-4 4N24_ara]